MKIGDILKFTYSNGLCCEDTRELTSPGIILKVLPASDKSINNDDLFGYQKEESVIMKYLVAHTIVKKNTPNRPCYQLLCGNRKVWIYCSK